MTSNRLFIWLGATVLGLLLSGFRHLPHSKPPVQADKSTQPLAPQTDRAQTLKFPLDLSVPFKCADSPAPPTIEKNAADAVVIGDLFAAKPKPPASPFQLKGDLIISPEPEVEKKKTYDGAGITLDIKQ
jgi:hypothetical protein